MEFQISKHFPFYTMNNKRGTPSKFFFAKKKLKEICVVEIIRRLLCFGCEKRFALLKVFIHSVVGCKQAVG